MASLYKRATFPQQRILRIIEGAVKNVADAHGEEFDPRRARSIAKRAAGTLSSQLTEVLAASGPSQKAVRKTTSDLRQRLATKFSVVVGSPDASRARKGTGSGLQSRSPLLKLEKQLFTQMRDIKNSGNVERANAFIDVLRMISALKEN